MIRKLSHISDFCLIDSPPDYRLSQFERLTLTGGGELVKAISWITKQLSAFSIQKILSIPEIDRIRESADFYRKLSHMHNPADFFVPAQAAPQVKETPVHGLHDGLIVDLEFASSYRVVNEAFRSDYELYPENHRVYARMWRHHAGAKAALIAIHGWTMGDQRLNSLALLPGLFYQAGLDVIVYELPYHGRRRPAAAGGQGLFPSAHIARTNEAFGQVIRDLRDLRLHLNSQGTSDVGCLGMSLGGYCAALWAALDSLSFCVPVVPLVSLPDLAWQILRRGHAAETLRAHRLSPRFLREAYYVHSPLTHRLSTSRQRLLIVAGRGDKMIPVRQPKMLWEHWGKPPLLMLRGGHAAQLGGMQAFGEVLKLFERLGYISAPDSH